MQELKDIKTNMKDGFSWVIKKIDSLGDIYATKQEVEDLKRELDVKDNNVEQDKLWWLQYKGTIIASFIWLIGVVVAVILTSYLSK